MAETDMQKFLQTIEGESQNETELRQLLNKAAALTTHYQFTYEQMRDFLRQMVRGTALERITIDNASPIEAAQISRGEVFAIAHNIVGILRKGQYLTVRFYAQDAPHRKARSRF